MDKMVEDQMNQMVDMLKVTDESSVKVPEEEPSVETPPAEGPPAEEPPVEEPPAESPVEPPVEEPPAEPAPEPEIDLEQIKKENEELRKRIDEMSAPEPEPKPEPEPEPAPEPIPTPKPEPLKEVDFVGDLDMDELTRDPKEFNKLLNKVYIQGAEAVRNSVSEGVLRDIPNIVKSNVATVISLRKVSEDFYEANEDLVPFKKVVAAVFEEVAAKNPDKKLDEIVTDVGIEARKRLELHKKAVDPEPDPPDPNNPPKLPRKKSQSRKSSQQPDVDPLLADIDEMSKSLNI